MPISLSHLDLVPKFLDFYSAAADAESEEERYRLWQERYNFAAAPPTEHGREYARRLLAEAWERYPSVVERLPRAARALQEHASPIAERVGALFELDQQLEVRLVTFVGGFEGNAFAGGDLVCFPVEVEVPEFVLAHELVHQVHGGLAGTGVGWQRSIAMLLLQEGLAMRGTQTLYPALPAALHLSYLDPAWVTACEERHAQILAGVLPYLNMDDDHSLQRFTMEEGPAGLIREGYWAGWHAVGQLQAEGWSLARLARLPAEQVPAVIEGALRRVLASVEA